MSSGGTDLLSIRRRIQQLKQNHTPTSVPGSARQNNLRQPSSTSATPETRTIHERQTPQYAINSALKSSSSSMSPNFTRSETVNFDGLTMALNAITPAYFDAETIKKRAALQRAVKSEPHNTDSWYNLLNSLKDERKRHLREADLKPDSAEKMRQALQAAYENATQVIPKIAANRHHFKYVSIWLDLAALLAEDEDDLYIVREQFKRLKAEHIGLLIPQFWYAYASVEDKLGNKEKARSCREQGDKIAVLEKPSSDENAPPVSSTPDTAQRLNRSAQNKRIPMRPARRAPRYPNADSISYGDSEREVSYSTSTRSHTDSVNRNSQNAVESPEVPRSLQKETHQEDFVPSCQFSPKEPQTKINRGYNDLGCDTNKYLRLKERLRNTKSERTGQTVNRHETNEYQPSMTSVSHSSTEKDSYITAKDRFQGSNDHVESNINLRSRMHRQEEHREQSPKMDLYNSRKIVKNDTKSYSNNYAQPVERRKYSDEGSSLETNKQSNYQPRESRRNGMNSTNRNRFEQQHPRNTRQPASSRDSNRSPYTFSGSESASPPKKVVHSRGTPSSSENDRREKSSQQYHQNPNGFLCDLPRHNYQTVNGKDYLVLETIGRGGSSTVFKVLNAEMQIFALKRVKVKESAESKDPFDSFANEISLLKDLQGLPHIVSLYDSEVRKKDRVILLIMEYGDTDLAKHLVCKESKITTNSIRVYWEQMLRAVHTIHEARVVHGDLKPANFLIVGGILKLIDFGIAKAIPTEDTTKIVRDCQIGTPNYMSPEALSECDSNADDEDNSDHSSENRGGRKKRFRVGRASDIWSLGCILHQMIYGKTPFAHIKNIYTKLYYIRSDEYKIQYKSVSDPHVIDVLKGCLQRDPSQRMSIPELLRHTYLRTDSNQQNHNGSMLDDSVSTRMMIGQIMEQLNSYGYEMHSKMDPGVALRYGEKSYEQIVDKVSLSIAAQRKEAKSDVIKHRVGTPTSSALTQLGTKPTTSGFSNIGTSTKTGERSHDGYHSGYR